MKVTTRTTVLLSSLFVSTMSVYSAEEQAAEPQDQNKIDPNHEALLLGNQDYYPKTWMEKGRVLYLSGNYKEAIQAFFKATRIDPKAPSVWFNLGMSYYKNHQFDESLISFLEAHRLKKDEKYLYHACLSYFKAGEIHQAIRNTRNLLSSNPKHGYAWKLLAQSYEHIEQFQEAKTAYQKAYELLPDDGEIIYALDQLIAQQSKELNIPRALQSEVTIDGITPAPSRVTLPMSKIFDESVPEYIPPEHVGLVPLSESYHLNFDSPKAHNFKPSEEKSWEPKVQPSQPAIKPQPKPRPKPVLDDL